MDGRGRALDNVFVERLWRTVKYEEVYLREYVDGWKAEESLGAYFDFSSHERRGARRAAGARRAGARGGGAARGRARRGRAAVSATLCL